MSAHVPGNSVPVAGQMLSVSETSVASLISRLIHSLRQAPITIAIVVLSAVAQCSGALTDLWQYSTGEGSTLTGIVSQAFTCHLTHWSGSQFFWDVIAFAVLGYLCEQAGRLRYAGCLLLSMIAVTCSVMWVHPDLASYRGLSGIDSALFAMLACLITERGWRSRDRMWTIAGAAAWALFVGKVVYELVSHGTMFVEATGSFTPLPVTHVAGAIAGTFTWAVAWMVSPPSAPKTNNAVELVPV